MITNPLFYFILSALLLLLASGLVRYSAFHREQLSEAHTRYLALDGLRGFLALGVFFHHAVIFYFFYATGKWQIPPSTFYTLLGQIAVSLFFMITGFLFWSKAIAGKGRVSLTKLLKSRLRRLVPMYVVSVIIVFAVAYIVSGLILRSPFPALASQMATWMTFGFMDFPNVNGVGNSWIINSVYWTLKYEWLFYLVLPLLAWAYRDAAFFVLVLLTTVLLFKFSLHIVLLSFVFGAVTAWLLDKNIRWLSHWAQSRSAALLVAVILALIFWRMNTAYTVRAGVMLFVLFFIVAAGNSLFGLLVSKPARLLGATSYSLYLLHSPILFLLLYWVNQSLPIAQMDALIYWGVVSVASGVLVLAAATTFRWVEYPFMPQRSATILPLSSSAMVV